MRRVLSVKKKKIVKLSPEVSTSVMSQKPPITSAYVEKKKLTEPLTPETPVLRKATVLMNTLPTKNY